MGPGRIAPSDHKSPTRPPLRSRRSLRESVVTPVIEPGGTNLWLRKRLVRRGAPCAGGCTRPTNVGEGGLEPPHPFGHRNLNPARLPIPPLARCALVAAL